MIANPPGRLADLHSWKINTQKKVVKFYQKPHDLFLYHYLTG